MMVLSATHLSGWFRSLALPSEVNEKTRVPVSLVGAFIAASIGATVWVQSTLFEIRTEVRVLSSDVAALRATVDHGTNDRFTSSDMRRWVDMTRARNPTLSIPDPK